MPCSKFTENQILWDVVGTLTSSCQQQHILLALCLVIKDFSVKNNSWQIIWSLSSQEHPENVINHFLFHTIRQWISIYSNFLFRT